MTDPVVSTSSCAAPPEPSNLQRAVWAETAIDTFVAATGSEHGDALCDLLTDLMHWASYSGRSFDQVLERARFHFELEGGR